MIHWVLNLKIAWRRLATRERNLVDEMDQLDELREKAVRMRGEYSKMMEMAASSGDTALIGEVSSSRIRMEEAESAHMAAVLTWKIRRPKRGMRL